MVYILKPVPNEFFEWYPTYLSQMRFADQVLSLRRKRLSRRAA